MVTKCPVNGIARILKTKNIQCQIIKFFCIVVIENPMGVKLLHSRVKVPKNKKALCEKGFKNVLLFYFTTNFRVIVFLRSVTWST